MGKILGFVGSPRRGGNTDLLVQEVLAGAREAGADTDLVHLADLNIRECDGCHACWRGKPCSKRDDMAEIYRKISAADVLIFGTPVYWYGPSGLMKLLIDRFVYFNCPANRIQVRGKTAAVVIPFEEETLETAQPVAEFFAKSLAYLEIRLYGRLLAPGVTARGAAAQKEKLIEQARTMGRACVAPME